MIRIHQGYVEDFPDRSTLSTEIDIGDRKKIVKLSVESEYGKFLSPERADYALVGMLAYALRNKHNIVCEAPVTEELLYNINEFLIPTFMRSDPRNYPVKIQADIAQPLDKFPLSKAMRGGVGTGISCGVDSFYSVMKHINSEYPARKLTHLCIFNNGSINACYGKKNIPVVKQRVFERAEKVAAELNMPLLRLESNFQDVVPQSHLTTHTYMDALAIYALQKLWRVYYYGSSHSFWEFSLEKNLNRAPGFFEPFLLDCLSTSKLRIISSGSEGDRNDKISFLADKPIAQKYMHVCLHRGATNCGTCSKCLRTLFSMDALGVLDNFKESFNVDAYRKNSKKYYRWLYNAIKKNPDNSYLAGNYKILYERHKEFFDSLDVADDSADAGKDSVNLVKD